MRICTSRFLGHHDQAVGPLNLTQGIDQAIDDLFIQAGGDQVNEHLGIGGRLENRTTAYQAVTHGKGIGQIAVMGNGQAAKFKIGEQGLNVTKALAACGGIAHMANGPVPLQAFNDVLGPENVANLA